MKSEELIAKLKNNEIPVGTKIKVEGYTGNLIISNYGYLRLEGEYFESLEGTKYPLSLYCVVDMLTNPNAKFEIVKDADNEKIGEYKIDDYDIGGYEIEEIDYIKWGLATKDVKLQILMNKIRELTQKTNAQTTVLLSQEQEIKEIKSQLDY